MADIGEIIRLVVSYSVPTASEVLNIFLWKILDGGSNDEDVVIDFDDWVTNDWGVNWADLASAVAEITAIAVDVVNLDGTVARNLGSASISVPGTVGGEAGAAAVSGYIKADTELPKTRGSKYVPGIGEGVLTDGLFGAESLGDLALLLLDFFSSFIGSTSFNTYGPGVVSRPTEVWVPFNGSGYVTDVPAYQRRRKPNVGS